MRKNIELKIFLFTIFLIILIVYYLNCSNNSTIGKNKIRINKISNKLNISKWIVVTSINDPAKQFDKLTDEKEFQLLVIADLKTNKKWSHQNMKPFI